MFKAMVNTRNAIEIWLGHLQREMYESVRRIINFGFN